MQLILRDFVERDKKESNVACILSIKDISAVMIHDDWKM